MTNITDPIRAWAINSPERVALITVDGHEIPYVTLDRLIDRAGRHLLAGGIRDGDVVGLTVKGPDEALAVVFYLALARIGAASTEYSAGGPPCGAVLLYPSDAEITGQRCIRIGLDTLEPVLGEDSLPKLDSPDGDSLLRVFNTSGTSGVPKHVALSHQNMMMQVMYTGAPPLAPDQQEVQICARGLGSLYGTIKLLKLLHRGGALVLTNPHSLASAVIRHKVTSIVTSPAVLQDLMDKLPVVPGMIGVGPLPHLRVVITGGSHLPAALAQKIRARLCDWIQSAYGTSETGQMAIGRYDEISNIPFAVGRLHAAAEVEAVDGHGVKLPAGEYGELRMRSPGMTQRYEGDAEATARHFRDGWFYPGDLGCVTADGMLCISGRVGDFINHGGVKVSPRVIEDVLLSRPDIRQAAAFGVPDNDGMAQIWAAIVPDAPIPTEDLSRLCGERLGAQSPKFILQMADLPRNANGKVAVRELVAMGTRHYRDQV